MDIRSLEELKKKDRLKKDRLEGCLRFHLIGVGGIGMSGLAKILLKEGFKVSGSDLRKGCILKELESLGVEVGVGHREGNMGNIREGDVVVYSLAIGVENEEYRVGLARNCIMLSRPEMLNLLIKDWYSVGVCGSHGKTTVSGLIGKIFFDMGSDPKIIVGGELDFIQSNVYWGSGERVIFEACEAYGSLLKYEPRMVVVTNIDWDHMEYFETKEELKKDFEVLLEKVKGMGGEVILNGDDEDLSELRRRVGIEGGGFGILGGDLEVRGLNLRFEKEGSYFDVERGGEYLGCIFTRLHGRHHVMNILGALSVGLRLGVDFDWMRKTLEVGNFIGRRLELMGEKGGVRIYSDYGHHPREVAATLEGVRQFSGGLGKVVVIFQPHLYTRTKFLYREFGRSLKGCDMVYILPIFGAREEEMEGVSSRLIGGVMGGLGEGVRVLDRDEDLIEEVRAGCFSGLGAGDIIVFIGAGDIHERLGEVMGWM